MFFSFGFGGGFGSAFTTSTAQREREPRLMLRGFPCASFEGSVSVGAHPRAARVTRITPAEQ